MTRKELGKIRSARVGLGGYQDCMMGISFVLGHDTWGVSDFWNGEYTLRLKELLRCAKVQSVDELIGKPVEVEFDGLMLKSWRILTEVL